MLFEPKTVVLKDGRTALFRPPEISDAAEIIAYLKQATGESPFLRSYPEEWADKTVASEEEFLQNQRESPNEYMVICEVDGKIAGDCSLSRQSLMKLRHRGEIGIALLQDYWGLGIGTALFQDIISKAKELGITQLELEVYDANERGLALYRKMGFEVVATIPNAAILKDGTVFQAYIMIKAL